MRFGTLSGLWIAAVVTLAALPAATADSSTSEQYLREAESWGDITFTVGPNSILVSWAGIEMGPNASRAIREAADGVLSEDEKDGQVSEEEADQFEFGLSGMFEGEFGKWVNQRDYSGIVLIDNAQADEVSVDNLDTQGLVGAVDQEGGITASLDVTVSFPNLEDGEDIHTVSFDMGKYYFKDVDDEHVASFLGDSTVIVGPAQDWSLDTESVQPDCAAENVDEGQMVFAGEDIGCFTGHSGVIISFAITGEGAEREKSFLPGFELVGLLSALLSGLVVIRRRL